MKHIIHLSDLHVGHKGCAKNLKTLIRKIKSEYTPPENYIVVVTGDIVESAKQKEGYSEAVSLLNRLTKAEYKVLVVPGNHDYGSGAKGKKKYISKFKEAFFGDTSIKYPKLDMVDGIAFIGLDSMAATFDWLDVYGADGEIGKKQRKALKELLDKKEIKNKKKVVYLHHHPFDGKGAFHMLKDYKKFKVIIENKIDCLLFGHNHDGNQYPDVWGIPKCYDASSSTGKSSPKKIATPIRVFEL